ncbi:hypothetical protein RvY_05761 [Ramazzottius varieornatus]|uniref:Uncharacterized protein n=1 Tax=Ramazzottius varieornatus TaxID=947166 RepID=A0A1D1V5W5_RAMVA|nr:hypothetical protein RvY_05761 [Ramazzottius varieornatus]
MRSLLITAQGYYSVQWLHVPLSYYNYGRGTMSRTATSSSKLAIIPMAFLKLARRPRNGTTTWVVVFSRGKNCQWSSW